MLRAASLPDVATFGQQVTARIAELADGLPAPLRDPVRDLATRPGKLLRPALLWGCAGFGRPDPRRVVRLGAVVELVHLASLLHDDMIDRAAARRGGPTAHVVFGREIAMLAGLACFALAGTESADLGYGTDRLVARTVAGLSYGELLDVERAFDTQLHLDDYLELVQRKTADLFRLSCLLGGREAGVSEDTQAALAGFGSDFGVAFQILDDCLDIEAAGSGKPAGTDHLLGLFGAPTLHALAADASGELAALLLSPGFAVKDMLRVQTLVTAHSGLSAAQRLARQRYAQALSHLDGLDDRMGVDRLIGVVDSVWPTPR